jgi:hypothetical protein
MLLCFPDRSVAIAAAASSESVSGWIQFLNYRARRDGHIRGADASKNSMPHANTEVRYD